MIRSTVAITVSIFLFGAGGAESFNTCYDISLTPKMRYSMNISTYADGITPYGEHHAGVKYHILNENGSVLASSNAGTSHICFDDIEECRYLFLTGNGNFLIWSDQEEEVIEWEGGDLLYDQPMLLKMGNCQHYCQDDQQLVVVGEADNEPAIYQNNKVVDVGLFNKDLAIEYEKSNGGQSGDVTMRTICLKSTDCYKLVGSALYIISGPGSTAGEAGSTYFGYKLLGDADNCHSRCDNKPLLADTGRGQEIMVVATSVSGSELLKDTDSPQYKAACWLIHDDLRKANATDRNIVQRYILAVLYYTLHGGNWIRSYDFLTPKHECEWRKWFFNVAAYGNYHVGDSYGDGVHCNKFSQVTGIMIPSNNLVGAVPIEVSWLNHLEYLGFFDNLLSWSIPTELGNLKRLRYINLRRNVLTGSIPKTLGAIQSLNFIDLGRNLLTGSIIWNFKGNLWWLSLRNNLLSGTISNGIGSFSDLRLLSLTDNDLTGTIPNGIGNLTLLVGVNLANNNFVGTIPLRILSFPRLQNLDLSENSLTGSIPNQVANESRLAYLRLQHNRLTGSIPSEISMLTNLDYLVLNNNALSGENPLNFSKHEIGWLLMHNNNFTGMAPFQSPDKAYGLYMEADCDTPRKILCPYCRECHGIFTAYDDGLSCSSDEMKIIFQNLETGDEVRFSLKTYSGPHITYATGGSRLAAEMVLTVGGTYTYTTCVSSSGCFVLDITNAFYKRFDMRVLINGETVLDKFITDQISYFQFGYSSNGTMQENTCNNYTLCNNVAVANSAKRDLMDKLAFKTGIEVLEDTNSSHHNAACDWVNYLDGKTEDDYNQMQLLQYYYLAFFYYETNGDQWANSTLWLTSDDICSWYGIVCDGYQVVTAIRLGFNNLVGSIPTEIAELRGLEELLLNNNQLFGTIPSEIGVKWNNLRQLNVSNNRIWGSLPSEFRYLHELVHLDLSQNQLTGSLLADIGKLESLRVFDLTNNTFSAELPDSFYKLSALNRLSLGSNLFAGEVSRAAGFRNLETLQLDNNFFTGTIPLGVHQTKLRILQLSGNRFRGSISTSIEKLHSLEEVYLYNNELTGSLPSQFGNLRNLVKISLSYNDIKGIIPSDIGRLRNLTLLHLHNNQLEGSGDYFDYVIGDYITDCGNTFVSPARIECSNCSTCCNVEGDCLNESFTWPRSEIRQQRLLPVTFVFVLTLVCCITVVVIMTIIHNVKEWILSFDSFRGVMEENTPGIFCRFFTTKSVYLCHKFQRESVYKYFLSDSIAAKSLAVIVVAMQIMLLIIFVAASDFSSRRNDWIYSLDCPETSTECDNKRHITKLGWFAFACILICYLVKDFVEGIKMVQESIILKYWKGGFAGFVVVYVTVSAALASTLYNYSTSMSNTDILKDAVILLFLNDIDDKVYKLIEVLYPSWVFQHNKEIADSLAEMKTKLKIKYGDAICLQSNTPDDAGLNPLTMNNDEEQQKRFAVYQSAYDDEIEPELDIGKLFRELKRDVSELQKDHINMKKNHQIEIVEIKKTHANEINEIKKRHESAIKTLQSEINCTKQMFEIHMRGKETDMDEKKKSLRAMEQLHMKEQKSK